MSYVQTIWWYKPWLWSKHQRKQHRERERTKSLNLCIMMIQDSCGTMTTYAHEKQEASRPHMTPRSILLVASKGCILAVLSIPHAQVDNRPHRPGTESDDCWATIHQRVQDNISPRGLLESIGQIQPRVWWANQIFNIDLKGCFICFYNLFYLPTCTNCLLIVVVTMSIWVRKGGPESLAFEQHNLYRCWNLGSTWVHRMCKSTTFIWTETSRRGNL